MQNQSSMIGSRFNRLVVICQHGWRQTDRYWHVVCDCGVQKIVSGNSLKRGMSVSCGCFSREQTIKRSRTHGHTIGHRPTAEHRIWNGILNRCRNPKSKDWKNYGGRGILVEARWLEFANFLADMGARPSKTHSVEREDNAGNYGPNNCTWATPAEQHRNTRVSRYLEIDGVRLCISDWAARADISRSTILARIAFGWSVKDAVFTPTKAQKRKQN